MIDPHLLSRLVAEVTPLVISLRRAFHRRPELSGEEFITTEVLAETARDAGLEPKLRTPKTGLTIDIGGRRPRLAFRADLDALPIPEPRGLPFASEHPGIMHACGHDAHAAIGMGLALVLHRLADELPCPIRVIFQPAEETFPGGAFDLVREGVMDGIGGILAFHVDPSILPRQVGLKPGAITSSADRFYITLEGPGGHTARPHQSTDLLYATGLLLTQLPALVDRLIDARAPTALVFGMVNGGTADNVIPTTVEMSGTLRTADREVWETIPSLIDRLSQDIVAPLGAKVTMHYQRGIPPVLNDARVVQRIESAIAGSLGAESVVPTHVSLGAEDYARYLENAPGALMRLGCRSGSKQVDLHQSDFVLDEACLGFGVEAAAIALLELAS